MRSCRAVTLVEVLVVTAIVGDLAAIFFAVLGSQRERAKNAVCLSNLRTIGQSLALYAQDHDDSSPPYWTFFEDGTDSQHRLWRDSLKRYGAIDSTFRCPLDPGGPDVTYTSAGVIFRSITTYEHAIGAHTQGLISKANPALRLSSVSRTSTTGYACDVIIGHTESEGPDPYITFHGNFANCVYFDGSVAKDRGAAQ